MIKFLRKKKNESALKNNKREKKFLNYQDINKILVIFNMTDLAEIHKVVDLLQKDGKSVSAWTVSPKDKTQPVSYPPYVEVIDLNKDLTWSKTLSKSVTEKFEKENYDTFIDLTTSDNDVLDYLLASNTSRFCVGIREREMQACDFIMLKKENSTIVETYRHLKYYLEHIIA